MNDTEYRTQELIYSIIPFEVRARQAAFFQKLENPAPGISKDYCNPGDWIVTREFGEFVLSDKEFRAAYTLVGDDQTEMGLCIVCKQPRPINDLLIAGDEDCCRGCYAELDSDCPETTS